MRFRLLAALLCAACGAGEIGGAPPGTGEEPDAAPLGVTVVIVKPSDGAVLVRSQLAADGTFVAPVSLAARAGGAASVDWLDGAALLGSAAAPDFALEAELSGDGEHTLSAVARGPGGDELGRSERHVELSAPPASDCEGMLDTLGLSYTRGPASAGIADPITFDLPINGLAIRYIGNTDRRQTFMMDCELVLALWRAADVMTHHGVVELADYGVYNYRCIDQTVAPPDCPGSSLSMHAHALAIDLAEFKTSDGTTYSVNDDFVIDPDGDTCSAATENAKDAWLHGLVCAMHDNHIFNITLTPNYNDAHRNHFHVDLTPGADYIRARTGGVDIGPDDD